MFKRKKNKIGNFTLPAGAADLGAVVLGSVEGWRRAMEYRAKHGMPDDISQVPISDKAKKFHEMGSKTYVESYLAGVRAALQHPELTGDTKVIAQVMGLPQPS